jgi:hypothetical protein
LLAEAQKSTSMATPLCGGGTQFFSLMTTGALWLITCGAVQAAPGTASASMAGCAGAATRSQPEFDTGTVTGPGRWLSLLDVACEATASSCKSSARLLVKRNRAGTFVDSTSAAQPGRWCGKRSSRDSRPALDSRLRSSTPHGGLVWSCLSSSSQQRPDAGRTVIATGETSRLRDLLKVEGDTARLILSMHEATLSPMLDERARLRDEDPEPFEPPDGKRGGAPPTGGGNCGATDIASSWDEK